MPSWGTVMREGLPMVLRASTLPALLLLGLEWFARTHAQHSDALAPPSAALLALLRAALDGSLLQATAFTLANAGTGLLIGALAGMALGTFMGLSRRAAQACALSVEILRPVPSVALVPIAMLVFGFGMRMEISVVAFATFWPMLLLSRAAASQVEPCLLEVSAALDLSQAQRLTHVVWPAMAPRLLVALKLGIAIALVVAVTVEIAANPFGMGYALMLAQQSLDPALMMAWLGWIGLVGFAINAVAERCQSLLARRMGELRA
jgi:sulfonate transport system permease protein